MSTQVLATPCIYISTYCLLLVFGIYSMKRCYSDNETLPLLGSLAYISLFGLYIAELLTLMRGDMLNFPSLVIISLPVLSPFAIFLSNFCAQNLLIGNALPSSGRLDLIDHLDSARKHVINEDYEEAVKSYKKLLAACPGDIFIHLEIAEIYACNLHDYYGAAIEYKRALDGCHVPNQRAAILCRMADLYHMRFNRPDMAVSFLKEVMTHSPGTEWARQALERINSIPCQVLSQEVA
jgi:tetratricopeptide (TPR) repeat protein